MTSGEPWRGKNRFGIAIVRISSKRQEGNISQETQERDIHAYCERNDIQLREVVRIVESAKASVGRKKYSHALARAMAENWQHVLFYMFDRETRNLIDTETNENLIRAGIIVVHYVRDNKVLFEASPDSDFLLRDMQAVTNKHFIRNLTAKVNDAMRQKAENGWYPSNSPPLGYIIQRLKDANGKELRRGSTIAKDSNERNVKQVLREFELRAQGYSYDEVRDTIVRERLIDPNRIPFYRPAIIEKRIANPFYEGYFRWKGILYRGKHEVFVPAELIASAREKRRKVKFNRTGLGLFAGGWLKCADCGCNIVYDPKVKLHPSRPPITFYYYHCSNGKRLHPSLAGMNVHESMLWEQFSSAVDRIQISPEMAARVAEALNEGHKKIVAQAAAQIEEAKRIMRTIDEREDRVYDDMVNSVLDADSFRRQTQRLRAERNAAQMRLQAAQAQMTGSYRETMASTLELGRCAKELYLSRSPVDRRIFLEKILSNQVLRGTTVEYVLRKPFSGLAVLNEKMEWRARLDKFRTACSSLSGEASLDSPIYFGERES